MSAEKRCCEKAERAIEAGVFEQYPSNHFAIAAQIETPGFAKAVDRVWVMHTGQLGEQVIHSCPYCGRFDFAPKRRANGDKDKG